MFTTTIFEKADAKERVMDANKLLRSLGVNGRYIGFRYVKYMIEQILVNPDKIHLVTKRLYPDTAKHFGVSTSSMERAVRTVIQICWERDDRNMLEKMAGHKLERIPTNVEFLDMMVDYIRRESRLDL